MRLLVRPSIPIWGLFTEKFIGHRIILGDQESASVTDISPNWFITELFEPHNDAWPIKASISHPLSLFADPWRRVSARLLSRISGRPANRQCHYREASISPNGSLNAHDSHQRAGNQSDDPAQLPSRRRNKL